MRVILLVAVAGCGTCVDPDLPEPLESIEVPRSDEAIDVLRAAYALEIGREMPPVHVTFVTERIPYGDTTVIGLHAGCDDITITYVAEEWIKLSNSALAHEVGHCARGVALGDTDTHHTDASWWSRPKVGVVERARRELVKAGL